MGVQLNTLLSLKSSTTGTLHVFRAIGIFVISIKIWTMIGSISIGLEKEVVNSEGVKILFHDIAPVLSPHCWVHDIVNDVVTCTCRLVIVHHQLPQIRQCRGRNKRGNLALDEHPEMRSRCQTHLSDDFGRCQFTNVGLQQCYVHFDPFICPRFCIPNAARQWWTGLGLRWIDHSVGQEIRDRWDWSDL